MNSISIHALILGGLNSTSLCAQGWCNFKEMFFLTRHQYCCFSKIDYIENTAIGVTLTASQSGDNVNINYTTTNTGVDASITFTTTAYPI